MWAKINYSFIVTFSHDNKVFIYINPVRKIIYSVLVHLNLVCVVISYNNLISQRLTLGLMKLQ